MRSRSIALCFALVAVSASAQTMSNGNTLFSTPVLVSPVAQSNVSTQGAYISWNAMNGGAGETDFINNRGQGPGGFAFFSAAAPGNSIGSALDYFYSNGSLKVGATGLFGNQNGGLTLGSSSDSSFGSYRINFSGYRDVNANPEYYAASIYTVRKAAQGFTTQIILSDLAFGTKADWANTNPDATASVTERMRITSDGNVGIATSSPSSPLEVNGDIRMSKDTDAKLIFADGTTQTTAWTGGQGGDFAESVDVVGGRHAFEPGDLLEIDQNRLGSFKKTARPYSKLVGGVYATKPGFVGRRQDSHEPKKDEVPMAMVGIVPTKVTAENGPIRAGDLLVSSSTPGFAMKGSDPALLTGAIVGKALGTLEKGKGVIEVLISLQ